MKNLLRSTFKTLSLTTIVLATFCQIPNTFGQSEEPTDTSSTIPICSSEKAPYRDFDFVIGTWDFYTPDGTKIGKQTYTKREKGCLILEEWELNSGETGMGMSFVDPETGLWRQVWMSPSFHIDYSGGIDKNGAMVLKGKIYPNNGDKSSPVRGIWAKQPNGTIKQEFFILDEESNNWQLLFAGYTRLSED